MTYSILESWAILHEDKYNIYHGQYKLSYTVYQYPKCTCSRALLDKYDVYIMPSMNPDGFKRAKEGKCGGEGFASGRTNRGFKDLNRDFPTWKDMQALQVRNISTDDIFKSREKETKLMMKWTLDNPFVLSASFHDGAVVVGYP